MNMHFYDRDRKLIEALRYDAALKPSFELIKSCLVWEDERPEGLTPDGYDKLCDLWIARSFIHRNLPFSSWTLAPDYFEGAWKAASEDGFSWPGFRRLQLSAEDLAYYEQCLCGPADE